MTKTRVDYELPFGGVNGPGLRAGVAASIDGIAAEDVSILYGRGHPESISDEHTIGLIFDVDSSTVTQANVDSVTVEVENLLGTAVYERGWGSHDLDYLGDYGSE